MLRQIVSTVLLGSPLILHPMLAAAADRDAVIAAVQAYNDAGNKGDRSRYASFCAQDAVVVDHTPPYRFQGPAACADEYDAIVAWGARNNIGIEDSHQKILAPVFFEVTGDTAYAVFPVRAWFKQNGRRQIEKSYLTAVLRRQEQTWRIEHLTYASLGWSPAAAPRR